MSGIELVVWVVRVLDRDWFGGDHERHESHERLLRGGWCVVMGPVFVLLECFVVDCVAFGVDGGDHAVLVEPKDVFDLERPIGYRVFAVDRFARLEYFDFLPRSIGVDGFVFRNDKQHKLAARIKPSECFRFYS